MSRNILSLLLMVLATLCWVGDNQAVAQEAKKYFKLGMVDYQQSKFSSAERYFVKALRFKGKVNKSEVYKMLAIAQFMQGKRAASADSFQSALRINSKVNVSPLEVLDNKIIGFFENQKKAVARSLPQKPRKKARKRRSYAPKRSVSDNDDPFDDFYSSRKKRKIRKKKRSKNFSSSSSSNISIANFLPFGSPQFKNSKALAGSFQLLAQIGAGLLYFNAQNEIAASKLDLNTIRNDPQFENADIEAFEVESLSYIEEQEQAQTIALAGFVGLWAYSVWDGIANSSKPAGPSRSRRRRYSFQTKCQWKPVVVINGQSPKSSPLLGFNRRC